MREGNAVARVRPWILCGFAFVVVFACDTTDPPTAVYTIAQQHAAVASVVGEWATSDGTLRVTVCEATPSSPFSSLFLSSRATEPLTIGAFECNDTVSGCGVAYASCVQVPLAVPVTMHIEGNADIEGDFEGEVSFGIPRAGSLDSPMSVLRTFSLDRGAASTTGSYNVSNEMVFDEIWQPDPDGGTSSSTLSRVGDAVCP